MSRPAWDVSTSNDSRVRVKVNMSILSLRKQNSVQRPIGHEPSDTARSLVAFQSNAWYRNIAQNPQLEIQAPIDG